MYVVPDWVVKGDAALRESIGQSASETAERDKRIAKCGVRPLGKAERAVNFRR